MAANNNSEMASELNGKDAETIYARLFEIMLDIIRERCYEIFAQYDESEFNPLAVRFAGAEAFFEDVDAHHDEIFSKVQFEVANIISLASKKKLKAKDVEPLLRNISRETWNYVYETYVQKKK